MSVAIDYGYEFPALRPQLRLVPSHPVRAAGPVQIRQRRLILAAVVAILLVLLMLPLQALGGATLADAGPAVGQTYIVKAGDTLTSIAQRTGVTNVPALIAKLAAETGSTVVVPGEHIRIP
jgi:hypothetical protein